MLQQLFYNDLLKRMKVRKVIITLGEDFPFTRLSSLMRRQQLTEILKQIFHLAPTFALGNLVADS